MWLGMGMWWSFWLGVSVTAELSGTKHRTTRNFMTKLLFPEESYLIRGACFRIYKKFRNTQKESVYQRSLAHQLKLCVEFMIQPVSLIPRKVQRASAFIYS